MTLTCQITSLLWIKLTCYRGGMGSAVPSTTWLFFSSPCAPSSPPPLQAVNLGGVDPFHGLFPDAPDPYIPHYLDYLNSIASSVWCQIVVHTHPITFVGTKLSSSFLVLLKTLDLRDFSASSFWCLQRLQIFQRYQGLLHSTTLLPDFSPALPRWSFNQRQAF